MAELSRSDELSNHEVALNLYHRKQLTQRPQKCLKWILILMTAICFTFPLQDLLRSAFFQTAFRVFWTGCVTGILLLAFRYYLYISLGSKEVLLNLQKLDEIRQASPGLYTLDLKHQVYTWDGKWLWPYCPDITLWIENAAAKQVRIRVQLRDGSQSIAGATQLYDLIRMVEANEATEEGLRTFIRDTAYDATNHLEVTILS